MSSVGVKIDQFNFPICNSFQAKILNDQLCYEIDLKQHADKYNINEELTSGGLSGLEESQDHEHQAVIYLDTIGMLCTKQELCLASMLCLFVLRFPLQKFLNK